LYIQIAIAPEELYMECQGQQQDDLPLSGQQSKPRQASAKTLCQRSSLNRFPSVSLATYDVQLLGQNLIDSTLLDHWHVKGNLDDLFEKTLPRFIVRTSFSATAADR
jgi:hypothetical protein